MLFRILSGFAPKDYYLISRETYQQQNGGAYSLPANYYALHPLKHLYILHKFSFGFVRDIPVIVLSILARTREIVKIMRANPASVLVACSGDIADIPAGFIASSVLGIPFVAYMFDDYVYQWTGTYRFFARAVAAFIFRRCEGVIGPNEFICDEYRRRYGVECILVRNPGDQEELNKPVYSYWPTEEGKITIMYTGAVYHANDDCFRNLVQALELLEDTRIELHIFTSQTAEQLADQEIRGERVYIHSHVPYKEILESQRKADILFLPLAFETPIKEVVRTSAPGKMAEYLASGRPILAHVPADSFVASYLRRNECGAIAIRNDPADLMEQLLKMINDEGFRSKITQNARIQALRDFDPRVARTRLNDFLTSIMDRKVRRKMLRFISRILYKVKNSLVWKKALFNLFSPLLPILVRVFGYMAETGRGTELCLKQRFLPMRVHYYSPVPDIDDLRQRKVWQRKSDLPGVDFRPDQQVRLLRSLGTAYGAECNWPARSTGNPYEFFTENNSFSFGCAASLHTIIRYYGPRKVFEIGSGNSSLIFSGALARNAAEGRIADYVVVDPYPSPLLQGGLSCLTKIIPERVELMDVSLFEGLRENDVLFIDSGHTVRTGSDVNFLFLDVLPRLAPGVIVHVHDIGLPYEYPEVYFTNPSFRMFWTESYLLQAFLAFNSQFEVMLALNYLMSDQSLEFAQAFPAYDPTKHRATSGSFWMRRRL